MLKQKKSMDLLNLYRSLPTGFSVPSEIRAVSEEMEADTVPDDSPERPEGGEAKASNYNNSQHNFGAAYSEGVYRPRRQFNSSEGTQLDHVGMYAKWKSAPDVGPQRPGKHGSTRQVGSQRQSYLQVPPVEDTNPIESCESHGLKITFRRRSAEKTSSSNQVHRENPQNDAENLPEIPKLVVQRIKSPKSVYSLQSRRVSGESVVSNARHDQSLASTDTNDKTVNGDSDWCKNMENSRTVKKCEIQCENTNGHCSQVQKSGDKHADPYSIEDQVLSSENESRLLEPVVAKSPQSRDTNDLPQSSLKNADPENPGGLNGQESAGDTNNRMSEETNQTERQAKSLGNETLADRCFTQILDKDDTYLSSASLERFLPTELEPDVVQSIANGAGERPSPTTQAKETREVLHVLKDVESGKEQLEKSIAPVKSDLKPLKYRSASASNLGNSVILNTNNGNKTGDNTAYEANDFDAGSETDIYVNVEVKKKDDDSNIAAELGYGDAVPTATGVAYTNIDIRDKDGHSCESEKVSSTSSNTCDQCSPCYSDTINNRNEDASEDAVDGGSKTPDSNNPNKTAVVVLDRLPSPVLELYSKQSLLPYHDDSDGESDLDLSSGEWSPDSNTRDGTTGRLRFTYKKVNEQRQGRQRKGQLGGSRDGVTDNEDKASVSDPEKRHRSFKGARKCTSQKRRSYYMRTSKQPVSYTQRNPAIAALDKSPDQLRSERGRKDGTAEEWRDDLGGPVARTANIRTDSGGMRIEDERPGATEVPSSSSDGRLESGLVDPKILSMSTALWNSYKVNVAADKIAFRARKSTSKLPRSKQKTPPSTKRFSFLNENISGYKKKQRRVENLKNSGSAKEARCNIRGRTSSRGRNKNLGKLSVDRGYEKVADHSKISSSKSVPISHRNIFNSEIFRQNGFITDYAEDNRNAEDRQMALKSTGTTNYVKGKSTEPERENIATNILSTDQVKVQRRKVCPNCRCRCAQNGLVPLPLPVRQSEKSSRYIRPSQDFVEQKPSRNEEVLSKSISMISQAVFKAKSLSKENELVLAEPQRHDIYTRVEKDEAPGYQKLVEDGQKVTVKQEAISPTPDDQFTHDRYLVDEDKHGTQSSSNLHHNSDQSKVSASCSQQQEYALSSTLMLRKVIKREIDTECCPSLRDQSTYHTPWDDQKQTGDKSRSISSELVKNPTRETDKDIRQAYFDESKDGGIPRVQEKRTDETQAAVKIKPDPDSFGSPSMFTFDKTSLSPVRPSRCDPVHASAHSPVYRD